MKEAGFWIAVVAALGAFLPQVSKLFSDRSAIRLAEQSAAADLSDDLLKKSREMIGDYRAQVAELRESSGRQMADRIVEVARLQGELDRQESEISRLNDRLDSLSRELATYRQCLEDHGIEPPRLTLARPA